MTNFFVALGMEGGSVTTEFCIQILIYEIF
jgi:hypothetical protein